MITQEKEIIRKAINEMTDSMTRIAAERDLMKEIVARVKENTTVTPKVFRKMARVAYKSNFAEEVATHEEFESMYVELMGIGKD